MVFWLTGLSGAGKSTIARKLSTRIPGSFLLDGDAVREGLNSNLTHSEDDRREGNRRIAEVAKMISSLGHVVFVAVISPYADARARAKEIIGPDFFEVFIDTSLEECERRDPKGLYRRARAGQLKGMTGIDAPYEPPMSPDFYMFTDFITADEAADVLEQFVAEKHEMAHRRILWFRSSKQSGRLYTPRES